MFDWEQFVKKHNIDYRTDGPNCARGHIVIKCPFCGDNDPSMHMGINLSTGFWGCWRDETHRGKRPHRLIMKLLGIGFEEADSIINPYKTLRPNESFLGTINKILQGNNDLIKSSNIDERNVSKNLSFPKEFREISCNIDKPWAVKFVNYLIKRHFSLEHLRNVCQKYHLMGVISGKYANRIVLPIYKNGRLVSWTARAISKNQNIRYLTLSEKEGALLPLSNLVYEWKRRKNYHSLIIVEGPFDMLKLDFYLEKYGIASTCLFGRVLTEGKAKHIETLANYAKRIYILLDDDAFLSSFRLSDMLGQRIRNKEIIPLNIVDFANVKDPGDMTPEQIEKMADKLSNFV